MNIFKSMYVLILALFGFYHVKIVRLYMYSAFDTTHHYITCFPFLTNKLFNLSPSCSRLHLSKYHAADWFTL